MKASIRVLSVLALGASLGLPAAHAQVSLTTLGAAYTQNFDGLPSSGSATWTNNSTIPGWFHARTGTGTTIVANDGGSNAGNLYSYGTGTATERALGSVGSGNAAVGNLFWGVRLQNNTGSTITSLAISYTGEQWRNSAAAAQTAAFSYLVGSPTVTGSLAEFQSAGVAVAALNFTSPITGGSAGALNGNLAANRVAISFTITGLSIPNGTEIMLRWADPDHTGADHGLSIDDVSITPQGSGPVTPTLSINDVTAAETNSGTTTFSFTVSLSAPAGAGGVTFDIATADNTATVADNDYVARSLTSQTISPGQQSFTFDVTVNGDVTVEPNETFFVNVTALTGANAGDLQGQGTITNDDAPPVNCTPTHAISQVQGAGLTSPLVGQTVTVDGVVTGGKFNGFFVQEPDASADGNPATSEGIFVFTNNASGPAVGSFVCVSGTVTEFATSIGSITQLTSATTQTISTGSTLPAPIALTASFPVANGGPEQLERVENMRVTASSFTATSATTESGFDNAAFFAVVTGVPVPFREPGIEAPLGVPTTSTKTIPPIPRFDSNPEVIRIDFRGQNQASGPAVTAGSTITGVTGVMDFNSAGYELALDLSATPVISGNSAFTAIPQPAANQITVGHIALRNYTGTATQQAKALRVVRDVLRYPDVLGVTEVNTITSLNNLRDAINTGQAGLNYVAFLGNGTGSQNVGFLVKSSRITVLGTPGQVLDNVTWIDPSTNASAQLHDRPPFLLQGRASNPGSGTFDFTVLMVHLRSLIDIESEEPVSVGSSITEGDRTRTKRRLAAENVAQFLQARQQSNPTERILVTGDYNAFQFNDGYVDILGTLTGAPTPDAQVVQSTGDLVNPNFVNLVNTSKIPAAQKYSYIFRGDRQVLDHIMVSQAMVGFVSSLAYGRTSSEFPEALSSDSSRPERVTDHDPPIAFITLPNNPVEDITAKVRVSNTGLFVSGGFYTGFIRVTNTSGAPLAGPLHVLVDEIAAGVTLTNATGTALGKPYLTLPTASLAPGATAQVQVIYSNPGNVLTNTVARVIQGSF